MGELLFLTQRIPYPPTKGDKIRSWHILKHLAAKHRVHLGCFVDDAHDRKYEPFLRETCVSVHCEPLNPLLARFKSLSALLRQEPLTLRYFASRSLQAWVNETVRQHRIEHVFVFCSAMAPYALQLSDAVRVLDMVDVDSQKWVQYASDSRLIQRAVYAREGKQLLRFERRMAQIFDRSLFVSDEEAELFRKLAPESAHRIFGVRNGVDAEFFSPERSYPNPYPSRAPKVVFTGAMDYRPNVDAVAWFVEQVISKFDQNRGLEFWIVGTNPCAAVRRLSKRPGVHVTGRVPDIRPYLTHADAVVVPLLIARGIQNKVLEAMAMGRPVIVTSQGKEGIDAVEGQELVVADDPVSFAAAVESVLLDGGTRIGERARQRVVSQYGWARTLESIDRHMGLESPLASAIERSGRIAVQ